EGGGPGAAAGPRCWGSCPLELEARHVREGGGTEQHQGHPHVATDGTLALGELRIHVADLNVDARPLEGADPRRLERADESVAGRLSVILTTLDVRSVKAKALSA